MNENFSSLLTSSSPLCSVVDESPAISSSTASTLLGETASSFPYGLEISFWERLHGRIVPNPLSLVVFSNAVMSGELGRYFLVPQIRRIAQECRDSLLERGDWTEMEQVLVNGKKNDMVQGIRQAVQQLCTQEQKQHLQLECSDLTERRSGEKVFPRGIVAASSISLASPVSSTLSLSPHNNDDRCRSNNSTPFVSLSPSDSSFTFCPPRGVRVSCEAEKDSFRSVGEMNGEAAGDRLSVAKDVEPLTSSCNSSPISEGFASSFLNELVSEENRSSVRSSLPSDAGSSRGFATVPPMEKFCCTNAVVSDNSVNPTTLFASSRSRNPRSWSEAGLTNAQRKTLHGLNRHASPFFRVLSVVKLLTLRYGSTPVKLQVPSHFLSGVQSRALRLYIVPYSSSEKKHDIPSDNESGDPSTTSFTFSSSTYANFDHSREVVSSLSAHQKKITPKSVALSPVITIYPYRWPALKDFVIFINETAFQGTGWKRTWPERTVEVAKSLLPLDITQYLRFEASSASIESKRLSCSPPQQLKIDILQKEYTAHVAICVVQTFTVDEVIERILLRELGAKDPESFHKFTSVFCRSFSPSQRNMLLSSVVEHAEMNEGEENYYRVQRRLRLLNRSQVYALYRRVIEEEDQGEVVLGAAPTVSTYCPLTRVPLDIPVRGIFCTHVQCVDLRNYLLHGRVGNYWNCVVCDAEMREEHICIDSVFWEYLNSLKFNCAPIQEEGTSIPPRVQLSRYATHSESGVPSSFSSCDSSFEVGIVSSCNAFCQTATDAEQPFVCRGENTLPFVQYQWSQIKNDGVRDIVIEDSSDSEDTVNENQEEKNYRWDVRGALPAPGASPFAACYSATVSPLPISIPMTSFASSSFSASTSLGSQNCTNNGEGGLMMREEKYMETVRNGDSSLSSPSLGVGTKRRRENVISMINPASPHATGSMTESCFVAPEQKEKLSRAFPFLHSPFSTSSPSSADCTTRVDSSEVQGAEGSASNPIEL